MAVTMCKCISYCTVTLAREGCVQTVVESFGRDGVCLGQDSVYKELAHTVWMGLVAFVETQTMEQMRNNLLSN